MDVEARILSVRRTLREDSVLGEYEPDAIDLALQEDSSLEQLPSRTTIYRVLERHGVLDGTHRQRRPAPPKGWHLPALAPECVNNFETPVAGGLVSNAAVPRVRAAWVLEG